jgi:two-component system, cell cycle sensor histidine kinase and response regulator CckA
MSANETPPGPPGSCFDEWKNLLFRCAADPLFLIEPSGRLLDANPAGTAWMFRYFSPENTTEHGEKKSFHFSRRNEIPRWKSVIDQVIHTGKSHTAEECLNGKKFAYTFLPVPFSQEQNPCLFVRVKEIVPPKRDSSYEPGNRQLWEMILDSCNLGAWSVDLESGKAYLTPGQSRLLGFDEPVKEWGYDRFLEHVVEEDREKVQTIYHTIQSVKDSWNTEFRIRRKDGAVRWFSSVGGLMKDEQGKAVILSGISRDITEEKNARIEHENFQSKMDYALENSHVGIWDLDLTSGLVSRTPEHDRIFGYESMRPEWSVDSFFSHLEPEEIPGIMALYQSSMSGKSDFRLECRIRKASGEIGWISLAGTFRFNDKLEADHVIGIVQDISDRKRAEIEREKLQSQLQQSQKMELVGQLAGGIAHDFNNILSAIMANAEVLINQTGERHPFFANLESIRLAVLRSKEMIGHLLAFARKQVWRPKLVDLENELTDIHAMLHRLIRDTIEFRWSLQPQHAMVTIDPTHLVQIITNLSINARDAIKGRGTITIETRTVTGNECGFSELPASEASGEWVMISVSDTGDGIAEENLSRIFEPFFTTKEQGKGTGLGLAVVYGIVKQNNGFIECRSEKGKGTSFHIFFPKSDTAPVMQSACTSGPVSIENPVILLIEDEPEILKVIRSLLQSRGFEVLPAGNAEEAMNAFLVHNRRIGMVISDVMLPDRNGVELYRTLRTEKPGLKYIFMSGYGFDELAHAEEFGPSVNFISKPFGIREFLDMVNSMSNIQID